MVKPIVPSEREVKRSHRTKRDLLFPDDESYYLTPSDVSEALYGEAQEPQSDYSDLYYDLLEEAEAEAAAAKPTFSNDIEEEEEEEVESDIRPIVYQGQPGYFVPAKRSDFLSFVPGNKRDQYFYPYSEEPQTHWGAFIPSKRDYTDSYANLVRLARRLALRENPRDLEAYPVSYTTRVYAVVWSMYWHTHIIAEQYRSQHRDNDVIVVLGQSSFSVNFQPCRTYMHVSVCAFRCVCLRQAG